MRIISGYLKGRRVIQPKDRLTRPLKDLTKESIFNIIKHSNLIKINIDDIDEKVKGNSENILPLDVNSVSKKASSVSSSASYEETGGETIVVKSGSQEEEVPTDTTNNESLAPVVVGVGGGDSEVSDLLYKGG